MLERPCLPRHHRAWAQVRTSRSSSWLGKQFIPNVCDKDGREDDRGDRGDRCRLSGRNIKIPVLVSN